MHVVDEGVLVGAGNFVRNLFVILFFFPDLVVIGFFDTVIAYVTLSVFYCSLASFS